jgi:predicted naringenin-chalcone synthase
MPGETEARKLSFLYKHSEIKQRYSVINDFAKPGSEWDFFVPDYSPSLDDRMKLFQQYAPGLSVSAIKNAIDGFINPGQISHLITVSCTGMSAPGLDLQIAEALQLKSNIFRTSVNFMGCYAAIHALKMAQMICDSSANANVIVVCTELCTIHFQQDYTPDNAASSLLFGDGSAAVLISNATTENSLTLKSFYSEVCYKGKEEMSWQLSNNGFLMKLSGYVPQLINEDISELLNKALENCDLTKDKITHWCLHPGGKKILEVIKQQLSLSLDDLACSRNVLSEYGNMSSPTILFVLKEIMQGLRDKQANVFGVAFGPGLTMETFIASKE